MLDSLADLDGLIHSQCQFIYADSLEEKRLLAHLQKLAASDHSSVCLWTAAAGLTDLKNNAKLWINSNLTDALRYIKDQSDGTYILVDAKDLLTSAINTRLVKEIAYDPAHSKRTLVIIGAALELPAELQRLAVVYRPPLPDEDVIREIYYEEVYRWLSEKTGNHFLRPEQIEDRLIQHLSGLNEEDVRRLITQTIRDDKQLTESDITRIDMFKRDNLGKQGLVEFSTETLGLEKVGGLSNLKAWLKLRRTTFMGDEAVTGIDPPKGILLLGVQGSGKSLAAKAVAATWKVPLLRLDFGNLYNKWIGESENNLRVALRQAEAMAPCVLWIDEIEKGVSGNSDSDADGGLSRRILGSLLTWMSERKTHVFLVATANDVSRLPPELLRKGRFDEIFFVDLPSPSVRREIFAIHIAKRKLIPENFDIQELAVAAEGYSGSEIEQAIVGGMYRALGSQETPVTRHIIEELAHTRPLSILMGEKIAALRLWARDRTSPADTP